jgi:hypothetical protein
LGGELPVGVVACSRDADKLSRDRDIPTVDVLRMEELSINEGLLTMGAPSGGKSTRVTSGGAGQLGSIRP